MVDLTASIRARSSVGPAIASMCCVRAGTRAPPRFVQSVALHFITDVKLGLEFQKTNAGLEALEPTAPRKNKQTLLP